ncbi:hypothetical protein [Bombella apis]|uniref:hypothetical protein n=1 Tax=Bombella apis TaxID=1785988 RepID=UPI0012B93139|nr:hypothetical protein [Bombella apis]MPV99799.1 hypothetical protein [Bombella apis]
MADQIVNAGNGDFINLGDPTDTDQVYTTGQRQISADAQNEIGKYPALLLVDLQNRGGPQTRAYLETLKELAASQRIYGHWPKLPARIED